MNRWLRYSIDYAHQRAYLDDLFRIYPTIPEGIRDIDENKWAVVENAFRQQDNLALFRSLLDLELFPIKDSYVAYFRHDKSAIERNPNTVNRICGRAYELGITELFKRCSEPKETNRQIGPMFKDWVNSASLGIKPIGIDEFAHSSGNAILDASDKVMMDFARETLNYHHNKGLDFVARFNGKYVIGEAKFLTDFGGHQNAQYNDAISTIETEGVNAIKIAILDGVLYIEGRNKMYQDLTTTHKDCNIMSALTLREFLYQL